MKIGFLANDVSTEDESYTTLRLAVAATQRGHEAWLMGVGDLGYEPDGTMTALASAGEPTKAYRSRERYLEDVRKDAGRQRVALSEFDAIMLRNDPADDAVSRPWAPTAAVAFGRMIADSGVLVVNDPTTLQGALSKAYFQHFPEVVRPRTLITRDEDHITAFIEAEGGRAVLKPLQGSGGSGVFLVNSDQQPNVRQIIEAIRRDGYVVAQQYLPAAADGDVRMFIMNGRPLTVDGRIAAFRRRSGSGDIRSNMSVGGKAVKADITPEMLELVDAVRPKLVDDGLFLVGLDIVGDKLMEVNVFSPGGLGSCQALYGIDFAPAVIGALEDKVRMRRHYGHMISNVRLATL